MSRRYLEVTYRDGRPIAAYLHLPRDSGAKSARTVTMGKGFLADFSEDGRLLGLEITVPGSASPEEVNAVLHQLGDPELERGELAPRAV
jgi:hypothetical protein